jgi:hypothetical protein
MIYSSGTGHTVLPHFFKRWKNRDEPWSMKARRAPQFIQWLLVPFGRRWLVAKRDAPAPPGAATSFTLDTATADEVDISHNLAFGRQSENDGCRPMDNGQANA